MDAEAKMVRTFLIIYSAVLLLVVGLVVWKRFAPRPLPALGQVPPFHFKAEDGRLFDSRELSGKVWVADFFYCTCHSSCPIQTAYMSGFQKKWKNRGDFNLVSFTLDPKDDTLPVLAKYAQDTGADREKWFFLTGDKAEIYLLAQNGFKVTAQVDNTTAVPEFIHSTRLILVDKSGEMRGYYNVLQDDEMKKLEQDLRQLL